MIDLKYYNGSAGDGEGERWYACADCGGGSKTTTSNRMYPESAMTCYNGTWYCKEHYRWRWNKYNTDQTDNPTFENEQG